jgi:hypothetical protein
VLVTLGAPRRPGRLSRPRARAAEPDPAPAAVSTGRATIIDVGRPFADLDRARSWLASAGEDELTEGLTVLNRIVHALRLVSSDPTVGPVARERLIAARVGYGRGDQLADGRLEQAVEIPPPSGPRGRRRTLASGARLAAVLGDRERVPMCAELVLRARSDLDAERSREASLQTLVALDAALAELGSDPHAAGLRDRLEELRGHREAIAAAAQRALGAVPDASGRAQVAATVGRLEALLRAHAAGPGRPA